MSLFEWIASLTLAALVVVGLPHMAYISFAFGKVIAELHAINEKLGGQLDWIKALDSKTDDHERRLAKLESHG